MAVAAGCQGLPLHLFGRQIYTRIDLAHHEPQILAKNGPCPLPALIVSLQNPLPHIPLQIGLTVLLAGEKQSKSLIPTRQQHFIQFVMLHPKRGHGVINDQAPPHPNLRNFLLSVCCHSFFHMHLN